MSDTMENQIAIEDVGSDDNDGIFLDIATSAASNSTSSSERATRRRSGSPTAPDSEDSIGAISNDSNSDKYYETEPVDSDGGGASFQISKPSEIRYGKCKWFNVAKGWGFITPNDGGSEVFVHQSVIQMNGFRSLAAQEDVQFMSIETSRGIEATCVAGREGLDCVGSTVRPRPRHRSNGNRFARRLRCYNCNRFNHIAAECKLDPQPRRCYICQQEGHLIATCPQSGLEEPSES